MLFQKKHILDVAALSYSVVCGAMLAIGI